MALLLELVQREPLGVVPTKTLCQTIGLLSIKLDLMDFNGNAVIVVLKDRKKNLGEK
jgi:hypothetical protein